jgi:hypothetical protein
MSGPFPSKTGRAGAGISAMQDFVEAPTDDKIARRPQRAETGRKAWAAVGQIATYTWVT